MKRINGVLTVFAKIGEVIHWVGSIVMLILGVIIIANDSFAKLIIESLKESDDLQVYSFSANFTTCESIQATAGILALTLITGAIIFSLMAMIFRNVYLSLKTAEGKTKFSQGCTPFQPDVVRMIREIGIFSILIPAVSLVSSVISTLLGSGAEISVQLGGVFWGLVVLSLSQIFAHATELQKDTEGLV